MNTAQKSKIKAAFQSGKLRVRSVSPDGVETWKRVLEVHRAEVGPESIVEVTTMRGSSVFTAGHRVFVTPISKVEAGDLSPRMETVGGEVLSVKSLPSRRYMYDLTAKGWHNFYLHRSGLLVSNSPDRNYHFRPPAHESTIQQFNQVFGYIWEDEELQEYLFRSIDMISASPPRTPIMSVDQLVQSYPEWRTLMLNGAMMHALLALMINWIADEFSYSIGGVSLDIEKSSKYESAYQAMNDQFDKQLERAKQTVKIVKGLQQSRYGVGIRSAFGPYTGRGVLTPRKFLGW